MLLFLVRSSPMAIAAKKTCAFGFLRLSCACRSYRVVGLLPLVFSSLRDLFFKLSSVVFF